MRERGNSCGVDAVGLGGEWIEYLGNIIYVGSEHLLNDDRDNFFVRLFRFVFDATKKFRSKGREWE